MASPAINKRVLTVQINRYMTLLSNLANPPVDYINSLDYLKGLVTAGNEAEISQLQQVWDGIKPTDRRNRDYIETGRLPDSQE